MQTLFALQQGVTNVFSYEDFGQSLGYLAIFSAVVALAFGIVLGIVLMIIGRILGLRIGFGSAFVTMFLYALAVNAVIYGLIYYGQVTYDDMQWAAQLGEFAVIALYGLKVLLISQGVGLLILLIGINSGARDADYGRPSALSVLIVAILMAAIGIAAFGGVNYGLLTYHAG